MNLSRKLEIVKTAIDSLAKHSDADKEVRFACLDEIQNYITKSRADIEEEIKDKIAKSLGN